MLRRSLITALALAAAVLTTTAAPAAPMPPDEFVQKVSSDVIDSAKADKAIQNGDMARIRALVEVKVMPYVDFERMTAMSVGPPWRSATPEQRKRMLQEFETLLLNTYAGALSQVKDLTLQIKPMRGKQDPDDVLVRTEVRGSGDPIQLDYRLERAGNDWRIYNVNVGGFWLVEAYRGQFAKDLSTGGIDTLINALAQKNKSLASSRQ